MSRKYFSRGRGWGKETLRRTLIIREVLGVGTGEVKRRNSPGSLISCCFPAWRSWPLPAFPMVLRTYYTFEHSSGMVWELGIGMGVRGWGVNGGPDQRRASVCSTHESHSLPRWGGDDKWNTIQTTMGTQHNSLFIIGNRRQWSLYGPAAFTFLIQPEILFPTQAGKRSPAGLGGIKHTRLFKWVDTQKSKGAGKGDFITTLTHAYNNLQHSHQLKSTPPPTESRTAALPIPLHFKLTSP